MPQFRHGQWVTTSTPIPGAHSDSEGRAVGIYQQATRRSHAAILEIDGANVTNLTPECVIFVRPDGTNLMRIADDGQTLERVAVAPGDLADLQPLIEAAYLPGDRGAHLPDGHKLDA